MSIAQFTSHSYAVFLARQTAVVERKAQLLADKGAAAEAGTLHTWLDRVRGTQENPGVVGGLMRRSEGLRPADARTQVAKLSNNVEFRDAIALANGLRAGHAPAPAPTLWGQQKQILGHAETAHQAAVEALTKGGPQDQARLVGDLAMGQIDAVRPNAVARYAKALSQAAPNDRAAVDVYYNHQLHDMLSPRLNPSEQGLAMVDLAREQLRQYRHSTGRGVAQVANSGVFSAVAETSGHPLARFTADAVAAQPALAHSESFLNDALLNLHMALSKPASAIKPTAQMRETATAAASVVRDHMRAGDRTTATAVADRALRSMAGIGERAIDPVAHNRLAAMAVLAQGGDRLPLMARALDMIAAG